MPEEISISGNSYFWWNWCYLKWIN
jgi:hypothetical protein